MAHATPGRAGSPGPDDPDGLVVAAYEAEHVELFDLLARATLDPAVAEECLENAFVRLASEVRAGRPPFPFRAWLQRVACRLVLEHPARPGSGRGGDGLMRRNDIDNVLAGLSPQARLALLLSAQGVRGEGIAEALGRTPEATRTLLSVARARVRLRRELSSEGGS